MPISTWLRSQSNATTPAGRVASYYWMKNRQSLLLSQRLSGPIRLRTGHIQTQPGSKRVETAVRTGVQVLPVRIRLFIQWKQIEVSVYRSHVSRELQKRSPRTKPQNLQVKSFFCAVAGKSIQMPASSNISFSYLSFVISLQSWPQRYIFSGISFEEWNIICYFASKL